MLRLSGAAQMIRIAGVDDDADVLQLLSVLLANQGYEFTGFSDGDEFLAALPGLHVDAVLMDVKMPGISGMEVLSMTRERFPDLPVVMLTGDAGVGSVVEAMRLGAYDYLAKPIDPVPLGKALRNALERRRLARRVAELEGNADKEGFMGMVGLSPAMQRVYDALGRIAGSDVTVLVRGESGTGKELVARAIHRMSSRSAEVFEAVNCGALPESLQESELFGHERGAFTGASTTRRGRFELADRGTLFLDELGELTGSAQSSLLRVLQEGRYRRLGGSRDLDSDFRLVAATHHDLEGRIADGRFRRDLFYRIAVFEVSLPPLRDRPEDIPLLIRVFSRQEGTEGPEVEAEAMDAMMAHDWPGNVRELQNAIRRALVTSDGRIALRDLSRRVRAGRGGTIAVASASPSGSFGSAGSRDSVAQGPGRTAILELETLERDAIQRALTITDGNLTEAAQRLGIGRTTLYRKLDRYKLR